MESKICVVCGKEFIPGRKSQVTCTDKECQRIHHNEYARAYAADKRKNDRKRVNEYNREWMNRSRAKKRAEKARRNEVAPKEAASYADKQKAKTLELVGRIQI